MINVPSAVHRLWQTCSHWATQHHTVAISISAVLVLVSGGLLAGAVMYQPAGQPEVVQAKPSAPAKKAEPPKFYSPLTGLEVGDEATTKRQVTAIMIENSPYARPQSGLKDAGVVFEAIAEGGITRFLTLHQEGRPGLIGPVRSLRPYYVDWLASFDAAVAHVGGSKNALDEVRSGRYKDIDQFFNGGSYWRATDRAAPHNVYTNFDKLDALNSSKGFTSSTFTGFMRKIEKPVETPSASKINITVSGPTYNVSYVHDKATDSYVRSVGGAAHKDRENGQITPKVVIAMKVPMHTAFEDGYREQIDTIGHGKAYIFQDGTVQECFWRKESKKAQVQFYNQFAQPLGLNPGQTWITVITPDKEVSWQ